MRPRGEALGMRVIPLLTAGAVLAGMAALAPSAGAAGGPVGSPSHDCRAHVAGLDLQTASFADLEKAMAAGRLTSRQLTAAYLGRIKAYDGPTNAMRALNPQALSDASRLDAERRAGHVRGPLHGLPIVLKDNIGTTDMPTTAGSIALEGSVPKQDAFLTARLRRAGAVILGKTNLSEFANWVDLSMPNGYSSLGGQVKNAYTMGDPSGSSSGSGVGESMAFAAGAFGSETSGSILSPSDVNGLVGVKPTRGLISRAGVIPLAEGFDTAGPMTRSVADAAALLTAVAGTDARDAATAEASKHATDYVKAIRGASLKGVRLGYSSDAFAASGARGKLFAQVLADLKRLGATLVETDVVEDGGNAGLAELGLIPNDFKANLNHYLTTEISTPKSGVKSLSDIIAFNDKHPDKVKYGQKLLQASDAMPGEANSASAGSLALRTAMGAVIDGALAKDSLDAILAPGASYANAGASAGYPTVIVPAGLVSEKTATGISFMGTAWSEATLLRIAAAYEAGSHRRVPPTVVNSDLVTGC
jgi:amidase